MNNISKGIEDIQKIKMTSEEKDSIISRIREQQDRRISQHLIQGSLYSEAYLLSAKEF